MSVFIWVDRVYHHVETAVSQAWASYLASSVWLQEAVKSLDSWYQKWKPYLPDPWKAILSALAGVGLIWAYRRSGGPVSPASSGTASPASGASSPGTMTPPDPTQAMMAALLTSQASQQQEFQRGLLSALDKLTQKTTEGYS